MSQPEEHRINQGDWSKVYGEPTTKPGSISVDELTSWYADKTPGKDFVVIDVRRADCEYIIPGAINLPAHSMPATLPTMVNMLSTIPKLIFHCNSSKRRGTRTAGWVADALVKVHTQAGASEAQADESIAKQVLILTGGINAWTEKHGKRRFESRGQPWDGKSLATIPL
ncbi:hypothetical protein NDA11_004913 [Ustilago hordei]|uniref:Rhodanese domain-containing protein n=1 Tax=Ustilago hordei TaxID=120017 RepID=I2G1N8_USTHO|nr:uncharacterized protein UHO2_02447 [Ustilago hordei]KAJ1040115.1 hypothetical protein NDA10_001936 [Ustilago hordei]KAJ1584847.1 hypothetical protein NDA15_000072 [Ustilago hordei]KAJ1588135.1 hypothetical protein NDA12_004189 [Ustilago hordei]KAJ1593105.1 hypothetical protein NDA11_004913 [Ustilago hordei]KAJ1601280.1 hypothetical protein NDA14_000916 [Ustilago hordei]